MPRVEPLPRESLEQFEPVFKMIEASMGFVPSSMLTMARWPELLQGFMGLAGTVLNSDKISRELTQLIAFVSSNASGCRYCQAHTSHSAERAGASPEKIEAAFEFETSPLFTEAERAALRLAQSASIVPNSSEDEHFEALRAHFSDEQIVAIVAVISTFGYLNRWNDTMATTLEASPLSFAKNHLTNHGWDGSKHQ